MGSRVGPSTPSRAEPLQFEFLQVRTPPPVLEAVLSVSPVFGIVQTSESSCTYHTDETKD